MTAVVAQAGAGGQPPQAPPPDADAQHLNLPVSIDRIRTKLAKPPGRLQKSLIEKPTFRVEITERNWFTEKVGPEFFKSGPPPPGGLYVFEQMQRDGPQWTPPMGGIDLLAIGRSIAHGISSARRSRAEDAAREEVRKALEEFWASQAKVPK